MLIRRKLQILSLATIAGLIVILVGVLWGLATMREAESTALRRESYSLLLERMKTHAGTTILLNPAEKETATILRDAASNIDKIQTQVKATIRRAEIRDEFAAIVNLWAQYAKDYDALIAASGNDAEGARAQVTALFEKQYQPFYKALDGFIT